MPEARGQRARCTLEHDWRRCAAAAARLQPHRAGRCCSPAIPRRALHEAIGLFRVELEPLLSRRRLQPLCGAPRIRQLSPEPGLLALQRCALRTRLLEQSSRLDDCETRGSHCICLHGRSSSLRLPMPSGWREAHGSPSSRAARSAGLPRLQRIAMLTMCFRAIQMRPR